MLIFTSPPLSAGTYSDLGSCVDPSQHGGGNQSGPFLSRSLHAAPEACSSTRQFFQLFSDADAANDLDFLVSNNFFVAPVHPYMTDTNINDFARYLDIVDGVNEYGYPWRDLELTFNYFHAADAAANYDTFGDPDHRMLFKFSTVTTDNKNHIDMYLNHPADNAGYDTGGYIAFDPDPKEDNLPAECDEVKSNDISVGVGYRSYRVPGQSAAITEPDPNWHTPGRGNGARVNHESQHIMFASRGVASGTTLGFPDEMLAMAAEYLSGAGWRNTERSTYNSIYDRPLVLPPAVELPPDGQPNDRNWWVGSTYNHWYLWGIYLLQQFPGQDTTSIYDDLLYEYVRTPVGLGFYNNQMWALAKTLEQSKYSSLGATTPAYA